MLTSNELELKVNVAAGTLESNAEQLRDFVTQRLQDYTPEKYAGKVAEAKTDRAVLNNTYKMLDSKRLEFERQYMAPFATFKAKITDICKLIKQASAQLDEIVKNEEQKEKDGKRLKIENYFDRQNFTLFKLEKIFDEKWLNKTAKQKDIEAEIDAKIQQTLNDLKVLENFPAEDVPLLKTVYLETLSITDAMNKAQVLKENRDRLAQEQVQRKAIETRDALREQAKDEAEETKAQAENIDDLVNQALHIEVKAPETRYKFALVLEGTKEELLNVKRYMTERDVTYRKLEETVDKGVYILTD